MAYRYDQPRPPAHALMSGLTPILLIARPSVGTQGLKGLIGSGPWSAQGLTDAGVRLL